MTPAAEAAGRVDVVVVGSANADLVVEVDRRPGPGETVLGSDTTVLPGGKGANLAVAAARSGAATALLGAVGRDGYGELLRASLESAGVRTDLVRTADRPTGIAYITVTSDGENSIVVSPGANTAVTPDDVCAAGEVIRTARVLAASLEVPLPTVAQAVRLAAEAGVRPVLNLSPVAELDTDVLAALDPLVVNEHEAGWLVGRSGEQVAADPEPVAEQLLALGPGSVVVTLGERGALVADRSGAVLVPAPRVQPVDTTGAGDAFAGALAARLAAGEDLVAAARFAVRSAAISVTRQGAQPSYPTLQEVLSS